MKEEMKEGEIVEWSINKRRVMGVEGKLMAKLWKKK
jgi:hypothetical protein